MGQFRQLHSADGFEPSAYDTGGTSAAGVVVLQEVFGVNAAIRGVADYFAGLGYRAIVPSLYDRVERGIELTYDEPGIAAALGYQARTDNDEALMDVAAAISTLRAEGVQKAATVGFCWGGQLSWITAGPNGELDAAVVYYGNFAGSEEMDLSCPVQCHFSATDPNISMDVVHRAKRNPRAEVFEYEAPHGFDNPMRSGRYDLTSSELSRERVREFLGHHLAHH